MCSRLFFVIYKSGMIQYLTCKVAGMTKLDFTYDVFSIGSDALKAFSEHSLFPLTESIFFSLHLKRCSTKANLA